jgi:hypothetical protein
MRVHLRVLMCVCTTSCVRGLVGWSRLSIGPHSCGLKYGPRRQQLTLRFYAITLTVLMATEIGLVIWLTMGHIPYLPWPGTLSESDVRVSTLNEAVCTVLCVSVCQHVIRR